MSATRSSIPDASRTVEQVPPQNSVEIQVGLGLSFHVSHDVFWKAQKAANDTRLVHYIGVTPQNSEVIGCDRETLEEMGCDSIVFVAPEYRSPMQQFGDFVMYGPKGRA